MASSKYISAFSVLAALTLSVPAWADIAPDDECLAASEGNACHNAIGNGAALLPGTCQKSMCSRATPDGPMIYECYRCVADDGGMGGQPNDAGGAGGDTNGGSAAGSTPVNPPGGSAAGGSAAGGTGAGTAGSTTGSSGAAGSSKPSDDSGCSVSHAQGAGGALSALLLALGFAVSAVRRRRVGAS